MSTAPYRLLRAPAAVVSLVAVCTVFVIGALRLRYPFSLEWLEGQSLVSVQRILGGQPLFTAPSAEYVSFMYTPLYYYASAALASVLGSSFVPLRLVSLFSTAVALVLVFSIVRGSTSSRWAGLLGAGMFAATFEAGGAWFDVGRVDMLFVALLFAGVFAVQRDTLRSWVLAGLLFAGAYFAKQTALVICAPLLAYCLWWRFARGALLAGILAVVLVAVTVAWDRVSDGWFSRFTLVFARASYEVESGAFSAFWVHDLLATLPLALVAALSLPAMGLIRVLRGAGAEPGANMRRRLGSIAAKEPLFLAALLFGTLGASAAARTHVGGWRNVLIPAFCSLSIVAAIAVHRALCWIAQKRGRLSTAALAGIHVLILLQFALVAYDPRTHFPSPASERVGAEVVALLARADGDVYVPYHPELAILAHKPAWVHAEALTWLSMSDDFAPQTRALRSPPALPVAPGVRAHGAQVASELDQLFRQRRFDVVICDDGWIQQLPSFQVNYALREAAVPGLESVRSLTGMETRLTRVFYPR